MRVVGTSGSFSYSSLNFMNAILQVFTHTTYLIIKRAFNEIAFFLSTLEAGLF